MNKEENMEYLTFGEQVKIILGRKGMTIKELAEKIEERTGKKMSRQNMTQRLGRDNFQEQDMRMIAEILGCSFQLSILSGDAVTAPRVEALAMVAAEVPTEKEWRRVELKRQQKAEERAQALAEERMRREQEALVSEEEVLLDENDAENLSEDERDMTIGELYHMHEELSELEESARAQTEALIEEPAEELKPEKKEKFRTGAIFLKRKNHLESEGQEMAEKSERRVPLTPDDEDFEPVLKHDDVEEDLELGEVNPYTGREYQSNSVRMHPNRIGYVQVYDRSIHKWTDMTEWAFLGYQERKKALLGKAYEPPIYLD